MSSKAATSEFRRFSDAISDPLIKAYRAGGFGLALLTVGAILMLTAFFWNGPEVIRYIVLLVGAVLTFFVLAYVYFKEFPRVRRARASVLKFTRPRRNDSGNWTADGVKWMCQIPRTTPLLTQSLGELSFFQFRGSPHNTHRQNVGRRVWRCGYPIVRPLIHGHDPHRNFT